MFRALALSGAATLALSGTAVAASGQQISVNGTGGAPVPSEATDTQQQTAYNQALTAAISDAQTKAQMVAQQLSLTLGPLQASPSRARTTSATAASDSSPEPRRPACRATRAHRRRLGAGAAS